MSERIENGIEYYDLPDGRGEDAQCARCGSSAEWLGCAMCGGDGYDGHDCGEDCCACLWPEENVACDYCRGTGGSMHCVSSPEWCEAHPLPERAHIVSTALNAGAWAEAL